MSDDDKPNPAILDGIRTFRSALATARNLRDGNYDFSDVLQSGQPSLKSIADHLASAFNLLADTAASAMAATSDEARLEFIKMAPILNAGRIRDPELWAEVRGLLADLGQASVLDDLPGGWGAAGFDAQVDPLMDQASKLGAQIGFAVGSAAAREEAAEQRTKSLTTLARESLAAEGVLVGDDTARAVVLRVLGQLGFQPAGDMGDGDHDAPIVVPETPWEIDFAPVPDAQHVDSVPDDVRRMYSNRCVAMIAALGLHPDAVVHGIFVSDETLAHMPNAVIMGPDAKERLTAAWRNWEDPSGWGPDKSRPFAVWYPVVRSAEIAIAARAS